MQVVEKRQEQVEHQEVSKMKLTVEVQSQVEKQEVSKMESTVERQLHFWRYKQAF